MPPDEIVMRARVVKIEQARKTDMKFMYTVRVGMFCDRVNGRITQRPERFSLDLSFDSNDVYQMGDVVELEIQMVEEL